MQTVSQKMKSIIESESNRIYDSFNGPSYYAIQNIVRRLDVVSQFFNKSKNYSEDEVAELRNYFEFGWAPALRPFYMDIDLNTHIPFPEMTPDSIKWADSIIVYSGKLAFCKQLLDYEKAGLLYFINPDENEFTFQYKDKGIGIEHFDRVSRDFFRNEIVERIIDNKKSKTNYDADDIKKKLRGIITNPSGKYISYETTPEIDEYYNQQGHYHILRLQGYDDFATKDKFGSIEYWKYVDLIEIITGVAIMHTEACIELCGMNKSVDMHNLLSYTYYNDKTTKIYSNYLGSSEEEIEQIFSCITLNKENFDYYLDYPSAPPPMYFQVSNNLYIRSIAGCLGNPFDILNRELKRRYKNDYDIAVNNREKRFREELYLFFPQLRIVKIPNSINISFERIKTDIDAILYDEQTKTLGLFQLKWQDPFSHSMRERFSRMTNLFPKANEWVNKIKLWIDNNTSKSMINSLQIDRFTNSDSEINDIYIFVLSRNQMNFTGMETDGSAAWGSWYQLIEAMARIETKFDDPIRELFVKLKMFSPSNRINLEEMPTRQNFDIRIGDYRVYYNDESMN